MAVPYHFAPFKEDGIIKEAGINYVSPNIEIPYYATAWTIHALSDTAGVINVQEQVNDLWVNIDSITLTVTGDPNIINYTYRVPHIRIVIETAGAGVISLKIDTTGGMLQ